MFKPRFKFGSGFGCTRITLNAPSNHPEMALEFTLESPSMHSKTTPTWPSNKHSNHPQCNLNPPRNATRTNTRITPYALSNHPQNDTRMNTRVALNEPSTCPEMALKYTLESPSMRPQTVDFSPALRKSSCNLPASPAMKTAESVTTTVINTSILLLTLPLGVPPFDCKPCGSTVVRGIVRRCVIPFATSGPQYLLIGHPMFGRSKQLGTNRGIRRVNIINGIDHRIICIRLLRIILTYDIFMHIFKEVNRVHFSACAQYKSQQLTAQLTMTRIL